MQYQDTVQQPGALPARGAEDLTFDRTVPCAIAHRRAVGEVFVTDSVRTGPDEFCLAWQIPRAHSLWSDLAVPFHDPFAAAEAARQASFVVVHRHLGVAVGLPFTLQHYGFEVLDPAAFRDDRRSPLEGLITYRLSDRTFRGAELGSMAIDGELTVGGRPVMRIGGTVVFMSRDDYETLRAFQRRNKPLVPGRVPPSAARIAPRLVGRADVRNIVIGEDTDLGGKAATGRYPLVVDLDHPSYFDHAYDHVPGPFVVEGFRQAAVLTAHRSGALASPHAVLVSCTTEFADFGEFEEELDLVARVEGTASDGRVDVAVGLHQFGREIASARIGLAPWPATARAVHRG